MTTRFTQPMQRTTSSRVEPRCFGFLSKKSQDRVKGFMNRDNFVSAELLERYSFTSFERTKQDYAHLGPEYFDTFREKISQLVLHCLNNGKKGSPQIVYDKETSTLISVLVYYSTLFNRKSPNVSARLFGESNSESVLPSLAKFGDLHGDTTPLEAMMPMLEMKTDYIFLGDYVDRGQFSLEVILSLFGLQFLFPTQVSALRGNHEDKRIFTAYGFTSELSGKCPDVAEKLVEQFEQLFKALPLGLCVMEAFEECSETFYLHGCIPDSDDGYKPDFFDRVNSIIRQKMHEFGTIELHSQEFKALVPVDKQALFDFVAFLWGDPTGLDRYGREIMESHPSPRGGGGFIINIPPGKIRAFCDALGLIRIVRGHQFDEHNPVVIQGSLVTLFSASNYCSVGNSGCVLLSGPIVHEFSKVAKGKLIDFSEKLGLNTACFSFKSRKDLPNGETLIDSIDGDEMTPFIFDIDEMAESMEAKSPPPFDIESKQEP
jgi:hypothetical protein